MFETLRGAGQEGGPVVVSCIKTTKKRDKCRSLLRSDPSGARDILPREGDLGPFRKVSLRETIRQVRLKRTAAPGRRAVLLWSIV